MKSYQWEISDERWAKIIGTNYESSVTIEVLYEYGFELLLTVEEFNGCISSCKQEIKVGPANPQYWNYLGFRSVCQYSSLNRFVIPTLISSTDSNFIEAKSYKWEILAGDAAIVGVDSTYEVFINVNKEDFVLQLTMNNHPDCSKQYNILIL
mgnify:CR=1 FL=1